jgi:hypothetical protein
VTLYTVTVSGQWLGKHIPVARQQIINNATVGLQQWKWGVSTVRSHCQGMAGEDTADQKRING